MASQIAHIIYAQKYFEFLKSDKQSENLSLEEKVLYPPEKMDKDEFMLGAVFPDIRRIDEKIKRKDTHLKFDPLDLNFNNLSSFEAGWKFHLYCDMKREEILNKYNFYLLPNTTDYCNQPAKMLEDEIVYVSYNNWEKLRHYFNNPPFIKSKPEITGETFKLWYAICAKYMEEKPNDKSMRAFLIKQPGFLEKINEIMNLIGKLRENKKIVEILGKVKEEIV